MAEDERSDARARYLAAALAHYGVAALPIGGGQAGLALEPIYQPLRLRTTALAAADERRELATPTDPASPSDGDPPDTRLITRSEADDVSADRHEAPRIAAHAEEALARSSAGRLVILGAPGAGKTTTLHRLHTVMARQALADPAAPLPFYLTLTDLARAPEADVERALSDAVAAAAMRLLAAGVEDASDPAALAAVAALARAAVASRAAVFLLDGLDEVEPARRARMIAWLNQWAAQPGGVWIIGSRYTEYKGGQFTEGRYDEWELLPLDRAARLELARRLLPALRRLSPAESAGRLSPTGLLDALETRPQTHAWAENPLLLSLAALVYASQGALPGRRAGLYDAVLDATLAAREPDPAARLALRQRIARAALTLFQRHGRTFSREAALEALALAGEPHAASEAALWQASRAGLIEAPHAGPCYFRHLTLQEYLVGEALADGLTDGLTGETRAAIWDLAWSKRLYSRWTETLRLMAGALALPARNAGDAEDVGARVALRWISALVAQRASAEGDPGALGFALALSCLSELPDILPDGAALLALQRDLLDAWRIEINRKLAGYWDALTSRAEQVAPDIGALPAELVAPLVDELMAEQQEIIARGESDTQRIGVLVNLGAPYALERAREWLWADKPHVVSAAIRALGQRGALTPELMASLMEDPTRRLNLASWLSYGIIRSPLALLLRYRNDPDPKVRAFMGGALVRRKDVAPERILAALDDADAGVRGAATRALSQMREPLPLEPLLTRYHAEPDAAIGAALVVQRELGADLPDTLLWEIAITFPQVASSAFRALAATARPGTNERLIALALGAPVATRNPSFPRAAAIAALEKLPNPPLDVLAAIVRDENAPAYARSLALRLLARVNPTMARPLLTGLLDAATDESLRRTAVSELARMGADAEVEVALGDFWRDNSETTTTALGLLATHREAPLDALLAALKSHNAATRTEALDACADRIGEGMPLLPETAALARAATHDRNLSLRYAALRLMIALHLRLPEDDWRALLASEDRSTLRMALELAPSDATPIPVAVARRLLSEPNQFMAIPPEVFQRVARALPHRELKARLRSKNPKERVCATLALRACGETPSLEWLVAPDVQRVDGQALNRLAPAFTTNRLRQLLGHRHIAIRQMALLELLARDDAVGLAEARRQLQSAEPESAAIRYTILRELAKRERAEAIPLLLDALEPRDLATYRCVTARLLAERLAPKGVAQTLAPELVARIQVVAQTACASGEDMLRLIGARLLWLLGEPVDRAPLREMLARYAMMAYDEDHIDCQEALELLALTSAEPLPLAELVAALRHTHPGVRDEAARLLAERPEAAQPEIAALIAQLLTQDIGSGSAVYETLRTAAPVLLEEVVAEAAALLRGGEPGRWYGPVADAALASLIASYPRATPGVVTWLETALDSPRWQTRGEALTAVKQQPRNTPDSIVRRLYALRHDPESPFIRAEADLALGEVLALESGLEDDATDV